MHFSATWSTEMVPAPAPGMAQPPRPSRDPTSIQFGNRMSLKILHVLDHSVPIHSGYTFRTLALLREQRKRGWQTFHVTSPKHTGTQQQEEDVGGLHFFRTPPTEGMVRLPG